MSVNKGTILADTGRGFGVNRNNLKMISGAFLINKNVTIPEVSISDFDYWFFTLFQNGSILPLHGVKNFAINDEDLLTVVTPMLQTIEIDKGKYRNTMTFNWDLAFHQIVETLSGSDYSIIYYAERNIILMDGYKGLRTSGIHLKKFEFPASGKAANSELTIELEDAEDLVVNGRIVPVSFNPRDIDRLYIQLSVNATSNKIAVGATYNGNTVTTLQRQDFSITDDYAGDVDFSLFSYGGGIYILDGLSSTLGNSGKVTVLNTLYLGCNRYTVTAVADYDIRYHFESEIYEHFESGNYELFN